MSKYSHKLRLSALLMISTIIGVALFQGYWIEKLYSEQWDDLKNQMDITFRDVTYKLQLVHFHKDTTWLSQKSFPDNLFFLRALEDARSKINEPATINGPTTIKAPLTLLDSVQHLAARSGKRIDITTRTTIRHDSILSPPSGVMMMRMMVTPPPGVIADTPNSSSMADSIRWLFHGNPASRPVNSIPAVKRPHSASSSARPINVPPPSVQPADTGPAHQPGDPKRRYNYSIQTIIRENEDDEPQLAPVPRGEEHKNGKHLLPFFVQYNNSTRDKDSTSSPLSIPQLDSVYKKALANKYNIRIPYRLEWRQGRQEDMDQPLADKELKVGFLFANPRKAYVYTADFDSPFSYIMGRLRIPVTISALLLAFTTASFIFLYRNLVRQQQIAVIRNEFISNMTHELKTPISTVKVAVEALRHFGALEDPQRAKEYLDISAFELQRLSLLVDKVLKLSMFENRQIDLRPETLDLDQLAAEVMASMKLQLDQAGAAIRLTHADNNALSAPDESTPTPHGKPFQVRVDRMHMSSVLTNLLDNALKYSGAAPVLTVHLAREAGTVTLSVSDNGIGIPAAYKDKIFEKFFRVPSGDHHNIKGYGLGLSYVHHIVTQHQGNISVDSKERKGSTFTIQLPAV